MAYFQNHPTTINWQRCLELSNHQENDAKQMLGYFVAEIPFEKQRLSEAYYTEQWTELADTLHRLKGALCYVGLPTLEKYTKSSEQSVKTAPQSYTQQEFDALINALDEVAILVSEEPSFVIERLE